MKLRNRNGYWSVDFYAGDKRVRKALKTKDRPTAVIKAKSIIGKYESEGLPKRATMETFLSEYSLWADSSKAKTTREVETSILKTFREMVKVNYVDELTTRHVDSFVTGTLNRKRVFGDGLVSPSSVKIYVTVLRAIFSMAVRWNYLNKNPFSKVPLPAMPDKEIQIMQRTEIPLFLERAKKYPEYADFFEFLLWTGLRRSEALNLEWDRVRDGYLDLNRTKTKKRRVVPLIDRAKEILESRRGKPRPFSNISADKATRLFKEIATQSGMGHLQLKSLRATFETLAIELAEISEAVANKITGHTMSVSRKHYIGMPEGTRDKLNKISNV